MTTIQIDSKVKKSCHNYPDFMFNGRIVVRWLKGKKSRKCDMADKSTKFCIGVCFGVKNEKIIGSSDNLMVFVN